MRLWIFLLLCLPIATASAQGDIHRCMGANGIPVFTDRVCSDVNASPLLPPASTSSAPASPIQAQPPPVLCASDMAHLKQAVVDAFADRNPNRLAGLMLWNGDGQQAVVADIRVFSQLMARPLIGVTVEGEAASDDNTGDPSSNDAPAHGEALLVQTESDDGSGAAEQTRFDVIHHSGCLWLHPHN
ncbi:DUF4124 domain-containing protein [Dyella caseinilytica]|uniref:DUF4124 domain-containing protein n=2 Tax=Dyella caseinilytica TaxID=1849581 RepID=A0ABX7GZH5_9GAMM|nr:DUF4124 domain-containing protein [Dyella caseinilytica]GFZ92610.1 hypothetical protein GCM10011408_10200 [Dyella caseinilytica]